MLKTLKYIVYALLIVVLLMLAVMLVRSERKLRDMRETVSNLKKELRQRKTEYLELRQESYDLKNNPHAVEKVAREKFRLVGNDEIVYKYDPEAVKKEIKKKDDNR